MAWKASNLYILWVEMPSEDWFVVIYMPVARDQYALKWRARQRNAPWEGIPLTGEDNSIPGPSDDEFEAYNRWLLEIVRPVFNQEVIRLRALGLQPELYPRRRQMNA